MVTPGWSGIMQHLIESFSQATGIVVEMTSSFDVWEKMDSGLADMAITHYKKDDGRTSARRFVMTGYGDRHDPPSSPCMANGLENPSFPPFFRGPLTADSGQNDLLSAGQPN